MLEIMRRLLRKKRLSYYFAYTLVFLIASTLAFSWFYFAGKPLIWDADGIRQHLVALAYYGEYLRDMLRDLVETGRLVAPQFDFSIGYGSDIPTTLNWYGMGDPLNLLFAFVPVDKSEYLYGFLVVFRMYLAGIAFSVYCRYLAKQGSFSASRFACLCGALVYVFCGFALEASVRHPSFVNPMIFLPLLLLGVEKIFRKQRPYLFILIVFVAAITDFYFCYMLTLLVVIYTAARFFSFIREDRLKEFVKYLLRFAFYYLVGLLLACLLFLPVVVLMLSTDRAGVGHIVDLLYPPAYYFNFAAAFITNDEPGAWTYLGFPAVSFFAVVLFFVKKKFATSLKVGFIGGALLLLMPVAGHVFNGFSYVSNRWAFGYAFVVAIITTVMIRNVLKPTRKQLVIVTAVSTLYFAYLVGRYFVFYVLLLGFSSRAAFSSFAVLALLLVFLWFVHLRDVRSNARRSTRNDHRGGSPSSARVGAPNGSRSKRVSVRLSQAVVLTLVLVSLFIRADYHYAPDKGNYIGEFRPLGESIGLLTDNSSRVVESIGDDSFYRYDENRAGGQVSVQNRSMLNGENSTGFYFSLSNPNIHEFFKKDIDLYLNNDCNYYSLDNRTAPGALAGVKYFAVRSGLKRYLPYGYERLAAETEEYAVYETPHTLPLGYTYDSVIPATEYEKFSAIEKQQALLQGAVVEGESEEGGDRGADFGTASDTASDTDAEIGTALPTFNHTAVPYTIECGEGVSYEDGKIVVENTEAVVTLSFDGLANCETYLGIQGLRYTNEKRDSADILIRSGRTAKLIGYRTPYYSWYTDQHDFLVNLGYAAKKKNRIEISFRSVGSYSLDGLEVLCQPMDAFGSQVERLKETVLENVEIGTDLITGTVHAEEEKLLCLSIPYNGGWRAFLDDKEVEMLKVNTMYSGIYLPAGDHDVVLRYSTPYFTEGLVLSLFGLLLFVLVVVYHERRARRANTPEDSGKLHSGKLHSEKLQRESSLP